MCSVWSHCQKELTRWASFSSINSCLMTKTKDLEFQIHGCQWQSFHWCTEDQGPWEEPLKKVLYCLWKLMDWFHSQLMLSLEYKLSHGSLASNVLMLSSESVTSSGRRRANPLCSAKHFLVVLKVWKSQLSSAKKWWASELLLACLLIFESLGLWLFKLSITQG